MLLLLIIYHIGGLISYRYRVSVYWILLGIGQKLIVVGWLVISWDADEYTTVGKTGIKCIRFLIHPVNPVLQL